MVVHAHTDAARPSQQQRWCLGNAGQLLHVLCSSRNSGSSMGKAAAEVYLHPTQPEAILGIGYKTLNPFGLEVTTQTIRFICIRRQSSGAGASKANPSPNPWWHVPSQTCECLRITELALTQDAACDAGL